MATESTRQRAQKLAYKAMESRDPEEALRLCKEALDLDPRCVDALVTVAGVFDDPEERAQHLLRTVTIAYEDLGGASFFEENKGHFWGLLETRPYMRARSYLAQTLWRVGKFDAAIADYEALLELNPSDNQGLRYLLIGLYLETDNVDGVCRLRGEYEEDMSAFFPWSEVLMHLISGDTAAAQKSLAAARAANPHFERYLLGRKPFPREMPHTFSFGDENEGVLCIDAIGIAWKQHPEAMKWLRQREVWVESPPRDDVGRNDPCPCGSGKKYKKCCLGREDAPVSTGVGPSSVAAELASYEMHQAMEGKQFSSQEELDSFIRELNQQRSRKPIDDFEGLSSGQMHRFINFPFESPEFVEFPSVLSTPPSAPIATLFGMLADAIGESGLKPTAKGNLPLNVTRGIALAHMGEEGYARYTQYGSIRSEEDYRDLHATRIVAELAGLIRKYKGKFVLTSKYRKLLRTEGMQSIYPALLRAHAEKFNWGYWDRYPQTGLVQRFFAYTLHLLSRHGDQWRENTFYEDAFIRAFPSVVDTMEPSTYRTPEDTVRGMYSLRCLRTFAEFLGLVEIKRNSEDDYGRVFKLRKTALLDDAVRFHL